MALGAAVMFFLAMLPADVIAQHVFAVTSEQNRHAGLLMIPWGVLSVVVAAWIAAPG